MLGGGAVGEQRRPDERQPHHERVQVGDLEPSELLGDDRRLLGSRVPPAPRRRPRRHTPSTIGERRQQSTAGFDVVLSGPQEREAGVGPPRLQAAAEGVADLDPEGLLVHHLEGYG